MPALQKATDKQLLESYRRTGSVHATGAELGMRGSSAHQRLSRLGAVKSTALTVAQLELIKGKYHFYADAGKLSELAIQLGMDKTNVCRAARRLGLTDQKRARKYHAKWKYLSETDARVIFDAFKASSLGLGAYCRKLGYDDLGFSKCMKAHFPDEYEPLIESKAPAQSLYRLGRAFEYRVRDFLKSQGYVALRSPASKSPLDLIAVGKSLVLFIQCKRGRYLGTVEWNELFDLAEPVKAIPVLATPGIGNRGFEFYWLDARKTGKKSRQPMTRINITASGIAGV